MLLWCLKSTFILLDSSLILKGKIKLSSGSRLRPQTTRHGRRPHLDPFPSPRGKPVRQRLPAICRDGHMTALPNPTLRSSPVQNRVSASTITEQRHQHGGRYQWVLSARLPRTALINTRSPFVSRPAIA